VRGERAVEQRAEPAHVVGGRGPAVADHLGQLHLAGAGDHDVVRVHAAERDADAVRRGDPVGHPGHGAGGGVRVERAVPQQRRERGAGDPLAHHVRPLALVDGVPDPGQRRVGDAADRVRVAEEAVRRRTAGPDDRERHRAVEHVVPGAPGDGGAVRVAGDALEQPVAVADGPSGSVGSRLAAVDAHWPPSIRVAAGRRRPQVADTPPEGTCR
jgi:hypothetical protein